MSFAFIRRLLSIFSPESTHARILNNLDWLVNLGVVRRYYRDPVEDPVTVMGLHFPNMVGLAAGMDADGQRVSAFGGFGFGHIEVGTVTAKPSVRAKGVSLRQAAETIAYPAGFQSGGADAVLQNLRSAAAFRNRGGILGVNIGADWKGDFKKGVDEYLVAMRKFYNHCDYLTLNLSCGEADQAIGSQKSQLALLLKFVSEERQRLIEADGCRSLPIAVKLSLQMDDDASLWLADQVLYYGLDALIVGDGLRAETPSLCLAGAALKVPSLHKVDLLYRRFGEDLPVIATGGIMSGDEALSRVQAGARLVQIYSGLIFNGPMLVADSVDAIARWRQTQTGSMASQRP